MAQVEERVSELEQLFKDLLFSQNRVMASIFELSTEMKEFKKNIEKDTSEFKKNVEKDTSEFKKNLEKGTNEFKKNVERDTKELKNEMKEFKKNLERDTKELKNEMKEFKKNLERDTKELKNEMKDFKKEMELDRKRMNKQWGDLANKMGTVVEDLILPNFHIMLKEYLNLPEPDDVMIRRRKKIKSKNIKKEFDLIAVYYDKNLIFLNETKSTANKEYINEFAKFIDSGTFFEFFPEYKDYTLVPVFSSIYLADELEELLTKMMIFAVHIEGSILHLKNVDEVRGKYSL